jgi:hypothetical protein|tara:strand:+ start:112 stop:381 length:270 start_codon:yes stop_codon:yes gene_type:complete
LVLAVLVAQALQVVLILYLVLLLQRVVVKAAQIAALQVEALAVVLAKLELLALAHQAKGIMVEQAMVLPDILEVGAAVQVLWVQTHQQI